MTVHLGWGPYGPTGRLVLVTTWATRHGYNVRHDRLVPTLVGAGMFGGPAVVMAACGLAHTLVVTHIGALGLSRHNVKLGDIVQCMSTWAFQQFFDQTAMPSRSKLTLIFEP